MNNFLKSLLLFVPFAIVTYIILLIVWGSIVPSSYQKNLHYKQGSFGHTFSRLNEVKHVKKIDVLCLGSSHCYRGFDTRIFKRYNINAFNIGTSNQSPIQTAALLRRYLDVLQPKVIIYEICPMAFSTDGVESALDILSNDKIDFESIQMALAQNNIIVYNTLIYAYIKQLFTNNNLFAENVKQGHNTYISGGFVEKDEKQTRDKEVSKETITIRHEQLKYFEETVAMIKHKNIRLVLVQAPIAQPRYFSFLDNAGFDTKMKAYGEYYNFNKLLNLNDTLHFYDSNHLNQSGVEIFDQKLIETIFAKQ